ncbi:unnamed protein product [[Candida] boidinii]|uniref:Unnamed protein product n=1 Tax=Candida boidinii TaxID=5477 RepID=A0ACB5U1K3_CANBO|nr:unnamed protein product [[Candida] boidinii]
MNETEEEEEEEEGDLLFSKLNIREEDIGNDSDDDEIRDITMDYALDDNNDDDLYMKDTFSNVIGTDETFYDNPPYFHNNHQINTLMTQNMNMHSNMTQDEDISMNETVNDTTINDIDDNGDGDSDTRLPYAIRYKYSY